MNKIVLAALAALAVSTSANALIEITKQKSVYCLCGLEEQDEEASEIEFGLGVSTSSLNDVSTSLEFFTTQYVETEYWEPSVRVKLEYKFF